MQKGKIYTINYQLVVAMQMTGCGYTDIATLAGFLDLLTMWSAIAYHMLRVEKIMRPVQILLAYKSKKEAIAEEVVTIEEAGDLEHKTCFIVRQEHPPLLMLKGSYGK